MAARLLLSSLALAAATIELNDDNFDKEVFQSGKAVRATLCTLHPCVSHAFRSR